MHRIRIEILCAFTLGFYVHATPIANREARVDPKGILRWIDNQEEVALLGVNLYTPFTWDYDSHKAAHLDYKASIRQDIAHLRRLNLGVVRIHCFERQFSDKQGNFIDNHHIELLDYLIAECQKNNIYVVLTPIAWWPCSYNGDQGFSNDYTMQEMTTSRTAWAIQARFLTQFAQHVNRYTHARYGEDGSILAFECINEPLYPKATPDALVTEYINVLADALRSETKKPIYYNSWQGRNAAAGAARIDGVTCSTYPTGLVNGKAYTTHQLARAKGSSLDPSPAIATKSRMVYEFDAADVHGSHMYPSMARFFRSEGIQVASQFQYDLAAIAASNTNWQTHFLNLLYTPGKAISLAIAAEVFRHVPLYTPFIGATNEMTFGAFYSSGPKDLSLFATSTHFYTSNTTTNQPPAPEKLEHVWGCGTSPIVSYEGSGAYFLDRVAPGIWRVQIYPDIFDREDAYTGTDAEKTRLLPITHTLTPHLPDLGDAPVRVTLGHAHDYLLIRHGIRLTDARKNAALELAPAYITPPVQPCPEPLIRGSVPELISVDEACTIPFSTTAKAPVELMLCKQQNPAERLTFQLDSPATIKPYTLDAGTWLARFRVGNSAYPTTHTPHAVFLPDPAAQRQNLLFLNTPRTPSKHGFKTVAIHATNATLRLVVSGAEKRGACGGVSIQSKLPVTSLAGVAVYAEIMNHTPHAAALELGFAMKEGGGLGTNVRLTPGLNTCIIPDDQLVCLWGLKKHADFDCTQVDRISLLTGTWLMGNDPQHFPAHDLEIRTLSLTQAIPCLKMTVVGQQQPWPIFDPEYAATLATWHAPMRRGLTHDSDGHAVFYLAVDRFEDSKASVGLRIRTPRNYPVSRAGSADRHLVIRLRAQQPETTAMELVLIEKNNAPYGRTIPVTSEWKTVRIPLRDFRFFSHWNPDVASHAPCVNPSEIAAINLCIGAWLFPNTFAQPHGFEISHIEIE